MNKDLAYYMGLNYRVEVIEDKEEGGFALRCPELPGCITCADTIDQGFKMIADAKKCWFEACLEDGYPIPEPEEKEQYSGQFKLRLPKSLHRELAEDAKREGISMNQLCLYRLSRNAQLINRKTDDSHSFIRGAEYYARNNDSKPMGE